MLPLSHAARRRAGQPMAFITHRCRPSFRLHDVVERGPDARVVDPFEITEACHRQRQHKGEGRHVSQNGGGGQGLDGFGAGTV